MMTALKQLLTNQNQVVQRRAAAAFAQQRLYPGSDWTEDGTETPFFGSRVLNASTERTVAPSDGPRAHALTI